MDASSPDPLALDRRTGWPDPLRLLLDRYPRAVWPNHANLGETAQFWLAIHQHFRKLGNSLQAGAGRFRDGDTDPAAFRTWFQPRLSTFLSGLQGHHQIEDYQFFPLFSAAEPRLAEGFEVLERDHETIHAAMVDVVESANVFLQAQVGDRDRMRFSADRYVATHEVLSKRLMHHLDDEEDLIVPLILDRGEQALGF